MTKNVVGLFDTINDAQATVRDLRDAGFRGDDISFVANNRNDTSYSGSEGTGTEAEEGAGVGATGGAVLGGLTGLLVGLGAIAIPGVGPAIAAGTLATALGSTAVGAGLGAAAGGLVGALVGAGIPENDANIYAEGIRRGGALVAVQVQTDNEADRAADIMDRHNVVDIDERGNTYRQSGWSGFDENDTSYSGSYGSSRAVGSNYGSGDADRSIDTDDYNRSSKIGTAGGGLAGAATGAAIGSAGGPVGAVVGGVAGAVAGGGVGAVGDAAGAEATDDHADRNSGYDTSRNVSGTAYGSTTNVSGTNYDTNRTDFNTANTGFSNTNIDQTGEAKIPIVEEELRVGKQEVQGGGVRVNTRVEERPVNEQVNLREERVDVHRRPADRPVSDADLTNFQEGTFEVRERSEQPIVEKQAQVVEEVHIKKNVQDRTENVQDTVRRTDVDVEQLGHERSVGHTHTDTSYTGTTGTTGFNQSGTNEGTIERGASKLGNSVERGLGTDLDNDGDVGQRDPRNNY